MIKIQIETALKNGIKVYWNNISYSVIIKTIGITDKKTTDLYIKCNNGFISPLEEQDYKKCFTLNELN